MDVGSGAAAPRANGDSTATSSGHGAMPARSCTRILHGRRPSPAPAGAFRPSITWWRLPYHAFGTQELSTAALAALEDRKACLLANHGVIAIGADLAAAISLAAEVENLALQYAAALSLGEVRILDDAEMRLVLEKFRTYGRPDAPDPDLVFGGAQPGTVTGS